MIGRFFRIIATTAILIVSCISCEGLVDSGDEKHIHAPNLWVMGEIPHIVSIGTNVIDIHCEGYEGFNGPDSFDFYYSDREPSSAEDLVKNGKLLSSDYYQMDAGYVGILITNFKPSTTYYIVCRETYNGKDILSEVCSFRVLGKDDLIIENHEAQSVTSHSITVHATVKRKDGKPLECRCFFILGRDEDNLDKVVDAYTSPSLQDGDYGEFEAVIDDLLYNTEYYFHFNADFSVYGLGNYHSTTIECFDVKSATTGCDDIFAKTLEATCESPFFVRLNGEFSFDDLLLARYGLTPHMGFAFGSEESDAKSLFENGEITIYLERTDLTEEKYAADVNWYAGRKMYYTAFLLISPNDDPYNGDLFLGEVKTITTDDFNYIADPVDLGLPSSIQWNSVNLGTESASMFGPWYSWGEVWSSFEWYEGGYRLNKWLGKITDRDVGYYSYYDGTILKYNTDPEYGPVDNKLVLDLEDDPANFRLGGNWRTPTKEDYEELIENCNVEIQESGGYRDLKLTSKINGNSIILPTTLWVGEVFGGDNLITSSLCPDDSMNAYGVRIDFQNNDSDKPETVFVFAEIDRGDFHASVRPVLYPR